MIDQESEASDDGEKRWLFNEVKDHRLLPNKKWELLIQWDNGEETWEPLSVSVMRGEDPVSIARYGQENHLLNEPGWKRLKHFVKTNKRYVRYMRQARAQKKSSATHFKFGVQVPQSYAQAMALDKRNGNTLWADAIEKEFGQLHAYKTFEDMGVNKAAVPPDYKTVRVHLVFDVKYDLRRKARLVAGGHLTEDPDDAVYSGIASLRSIRMCLFLGEWNGLTTVVGDVGNA